jgi:mRNA interferase MazF
MRPIHLARLDETRPALILTRAAAANRSSSITVAGITSPVRGLPTEVPVDEANGLSHGSVVNLDDVQTIPAYHLGDLVGYLYDHQESALHAAIVAAFDLDDETD